MHLPITKKEKIFLLKASQYKKTKNKRWKQSDPGPTEIDRNPSLQAISMAG